MNNFLLLLLCPKMQQTITYTFFYFFYFKGIAG